MGSPHYGFIIELKKSPQAVKGWQAQGHLIAVDNSLNFKWGGVYARIYGENYKAGAGVDRRAMGGALSRKPKPPVHRPPGSDQQYPELKMKSLSDPMLAFALSGAID